MSFINWFKWFYIGNTDPVCVCVCVGWVHATNILVWVVLRPTKCVQNERNTWLGACAIVLTFWVVERILT